MYERHPDRGPTVRWEPEDDAAAEQAMAEIVDRFDSWRGVRYELDNETAAAVRERYREIVDTKSGGN